MVLAKVGRGCCKKYGVGRFGQTFCLGFLSTFKNRIEYNLLVIRINEKSKRKDLF